MTLARLTRACLTQVERSAAAVRAQGLDALRREWRGRRHLQRQGLQLQQHLRLDQHPMSAAVPVTAAVAAIAAGAPRATQHPVTTGAATHTASVLQDRVGTERLRR
eukprot:3811464-Prymnesium_polylepis.1